jgi:hypothetical protein
MSVLLRRHDDLPASDAYGRWLTIGAASCRLDPLRNVSDLGPCLESAFDAVGDDWLKLGRALGADGSASLAQTPACAANISDMGLMMAWSRIVADQAEWNGICLVVCDDPWLFRHLAAIDGVKAGSPPALFATTLKLKLRGYVACGKCVFDLAWRHLALRGARKSFPAGAAVLLVYGHPSSTVEGMDGYFGDLMTSLPDLQRVLHVDCPAGRARELAGDGRSASLHGWGRMSDLLGLLLARWKPDGKHLTGPYGWLVRRAAAREGGTAQGVMIAWQHACQRRWLIDTKPRSVAWPWENHSWEREFVRAARDCGVRTIGYQHSVIGRQMLNYSGASNPDGLASIPDRIFCSGEATLDRLLQWGLPLERLEIGGALRIPEIKTVSTDSGGAVYLALPFDVETARQMIDAARPLINKGFHFVVKDHPMTPCYFTPVRGLRRTKRPFYDQQALCAVVYAATTVGLESALAGVPTVRFRPQKKLALDILPGGIDLPVAEHDTLEEVLLEATPPVINRDRVFSPVSIEFWKRAFAHD